MLCPKHDFQQTETTLLNDELLSNTYNATAMYDAMSKACKPRKSVPVVSDKTLIVNVAEGTTGTRWLDRVMATLGFRHSHNNMNVNYTAYASPIYEYIADSPVPYQANEIIDAYPNAVFFMSMRDGEDWRTSRIRHHLYMDPGRHWHPAFDICGQKNAPSMKHPEAATYFTVREIWLSCVLPQERLFQFNLFNTDDDTFLIELKVFLEKHGLHRGKDRWEEKFAHLVSMKSLARMRDEPSPSGYRAKSTITPPLFTWNEGGEFIDLSFQA